MYRINITVIINQTSSIFYWGGGVVGVHLPVFQTEVKKSNFNSRPDLELR